MTADELQAENELLRAELEGFRQRELEGLRSQLAEAKDLVAHYRAEAERNATIGRTIHAESQAEISRLRERLATLEQANYVTSRPARPTA